MQRRDRHADALLTVPVLRSLSRGSVLVMLGGAGMLGATCLIAVTVMSGGAAFLATLAVASAGCIAAGGAGAIAIARRAALRHLAGLPFAVQSYGRVLDVDRSIPRVRIEVQFAGAPPDAKTVAGVLAALHEPTEIESQDGVTFLLVVNSRHGSKFDGHRRWLPPWFRALCSSALEPIHAVHPIAEVRFRA